ncbi:hypothetical protein AUP74_02168 [Microbulbifer aggregans]|uniref:MetA-pathway of phenol degradation n=2 Tax=Microbulbifer aggregans TaxID=1769779 RepID=A0A1C9W8W4_9GAMM|nr:hypothetical protein AUP74_02168 [Microbulbifer aggregans]
MRHKQLSKRRVIPALGLLIPLTALCLSSPALAQSGADPNSPPPTLEQFVVDPDSPPPTLAQSGANLSSRLMTLAQSGADSHSPPPAAEAPQSAAEHEHPEHGSMATVGKKLSNPTSDIWALTVAWGLPTFYDGDINLGNPKVGLSATAQPVLPIPLYGEGDNEWRLITRPIIPLLFRQPVPIGFNDFDKEAAIGDIQLPLLLAPPTDSFNPPGGKWILAGGPVFEFPTATSDDLGSNQTSAGIAMALGYANEKITALIFPNYFWHVSDNGQGDRPDTSKGSMLYQFSYRLGDGWEITAAPTITYNDKAPPANKWNVPVGILVGKTFPIFGHPVKILGGVEYSVVSQDDFGKRAQFRLNITPVIPSLIQKPLFGGR